MYSKNYPRIVIGGLSGDSGKTVISCALIAACKDRGIKVSAFKKGPDYIDTAWLSSVSGSTARNLDTYLMGFPAVKNSFLKNAAGSDISIIEGNRGIFDGVDSRGTHSTAELAKLLKAPVIIVQNLSKVTRTSAASILGCIKLDPDLNIAGVILNQVAGERHGRIAKEAIEELTGVPVVGLIPRLSGGNILPSRHLGLITPDEYENNPGFIKEIRKIIDDNLNVQEILEIAESAPSLGTKLFKNTGDESVTKNEKVKIGYFRDRSFSFYYPENLEMLEAAGAELIPKSPSDNIDLEELDELYIGGGFPETGLTTLTMNRDLMDNLKDMVEEGLPVYAECGGLMYLARDIEWNGSRHFLTGILPVSISLEGKPQGHGYCHAVVDNENPFFTVGTQLNGHEFHYSKISSFDPEITTALSVRRGTGSFNKRDGITYKNVFASYLHVHALASPEWADGIIKCAINYKKSKKNKNNN